MKRYHGAPKPKNGAGYSSETLSKEVKDLKGPGKPETQKYPDGKRAKNPTSNKRHR